MSVRDNLSVFNNDIFELVLTELNNNITGIFRDSVSKSIGIMSPIKQ